MVDCIDCFVSNLDIAHSICNGLFIFDSLTGVLFPIFINVHCLKSPYISLELNFVSLFMCQVIGVPRSYRTKTFQKSP